MKYSLLTEGWGAADGMDNIVEEPVGELDHKEDIPVNNVIISPRPPPITRRSNSRGYTLTQLTTPSVADIFCKLPRKRRMEDDSSLWCGDDSIVVEGYEEYLVKRVKQDKDSELGGSEKDGEPDDIRVKEDDILENEDDCFEEFGVDDSWEELANNTLMLVEQDRSCLKSVVTSLDQPERRVVEPEVVTSISSTRAGLQDQEEEVSHIEWATRILDRALSYHYVDTDDSFVDEPSMCVIPGQKDGGDDVMRSNNIVVTGDDVVTSLHKGRDEVEDRRDVFQEDDDEGTVSPSVATDCSDTTNDTGKHHINTSYNFTCLEQRGQIQWEGQGYSCVKTEGVETCPDGRIIEENTVTVSPDTPLQAGVDDTEDRREISPLSSVDTVTPSSTQNSTTVNSGVASRDTGVNFTSTATTEHAGIAMSVRDYLTSTPVRTEAGHPQIPDVSVVEEPQDQPKCKHVRGGKCLTHGKQASKMYKSGWVTIPGPDGSITRKYRRQMYWQCDLDPKGRRALLQTRLSFKKKQSEPVQQGGGDTRRGDNTTSLTTTSEGQACAELSMTKE